MLRHGGRLLARAMAVHGAAVRGRMEPGVRLLDADLARPGEGLRRAQGPHHEHLRRGLPGRHAAGQPDHRPARQTIYAALHPAD